MAPDLLHTRAMATESDALRQEFTIDDLAARARVPSRTIRFYQSRGALMAPEIRGRVAYYNVSHLERLKLIAQLQDRGLRIDAIRDLVASINAGELDLAEWLGVEQQVHTPWVQDRPRTVSEAELYELAGSARPGLIADLVRIKLVERHGDVLLLDSPALLKLAMKLEAVGIDLDSAHMAAELVRKHLSRAVRDVVELFVRRARDSFVDVREPIKLLQELRPTSIEAVQVIFGREVEDALRKLLEKGTLARIPHAARARRKRTRR
jgi:DNA-binding transcriptional MerR regulator